MDDEKYYLFLLGGYDLEMVTIRDILEERRITSADRQLQWDNACLSFYKEELDLYGEAGSPWRIFGIELREDIPAPANYTRIDHHNQYAVLPSALEQVMELLRLPLDRYQRLVAANDKGYIPGMRALGATAEEISSIRHADRKAQGVTGEEEGFAELAITVNREDLGDLIVIHALSSRFSPICDRLFPYRHLLIYTDEEWVYYGEGLSGIKAVFTDDLLQGKIYSGGGDKGYVGTVRGIYSPGKICEMVEQIKNIKYGSL